MPQRRSKSIRSEPHHEDEAVVRDAISVGSLDLFHFIPRRRTDDPVVRDQGAVVSLDDLAMPAGSLDPLRFIPKQHAMLDLCHLVQKQSTRKRVLARIRRVFRRA